MRTLEGIKGRCFITEDGHWLWRGSLRADGRANIYAPDYTRKNGDMSTQAGPRAVWHLVNQKAVPDGYRVYGVCGHPACCNPKCIRSTTEAEWGRFGSKQGRHKGTTAHILANRAICAKRSKLTAEQILYVQSSPKTGVVLSAEFGVSRTTISKLRRGMHVVTASGAASANPFAALMR